MTGTTFPYIPSIFTDISVIFGPEKIFYDAYSLSKLAGCDTFGVNREVEVWVNNWNGCQKDRVGSGGSRQGSN